MLRVGEGREHGRREQEVLVSIVLCGVGFEIYSYSVLLVVEF